jgi:hypothetical protein
MAAVAGRILASSAPCVELQRGIAPSALRFDATQSPASQCRPATTVNGSVVTVTEHTDIVAVTRCIPEACAEGWLFLATPFNGLWAWNHVSGTKTEVVRSASVPASDARPAPLAGTSGAAAVQQPIARRGHMPEGGARPQPHGAALPTPQPPQQGPAPWSSALPLLAPATPEDQKAVLAASIAANAVAVVPSTRSDASVIILSVVQGKLHGVSLQCARNKAGLNVATYVDQGFLRLASASDLSKASPVAASPGSGTPFSFADVLASIPMPAAKEAGSDGGAPTVESVSLHVAAGARASARRTSVLCLIRGKVGSARVSAVGVLLVDSSRRIVAIACDWRTTTSRKDEVVALQWLGDSEHHVVVQLGRGELQLLELQSTDRTASAASTGVLSAATSPFSVGAGGAVTGWNAATFVPSAFGATGLGPSQRPLIAVSTADNAVQLLGVHVAGASVSVSPLAGYVFPPAKERIQDVLLIDEDSIVAVTGSGRVLALTAGGGTSGLEVVSLDRPSNRNLGVATLENLRMGTRTEIGFAVTAGAAVIHVNRAKSAN